MIFPTLSEFKTLCRKGNLIPVYGEAHVDWETPISAFRKIDDGRFSFLLESVEGGEKWGRYSFLGSNPAYLFRSRGGKFEILRNGEVFQDGERKDPLLALEEFLGNFHPALHNSLPRLFGGAVGYVNYDVIKSLERIPDLLIKDMELDDSCFMITDMLLVFDNLKQRVKVISNVFLDDDTSPEKAYQDAVFKIHAMMARLQLPTPSVPPRRSLSPAVLCSNLSLKDYSEAVEKAKEYIKAGDIIQVVLSQRFSAEIECDPFDIYRALRSINPSPYLFFLRMNDTVLLGASPEVMVRLEEGIIELRPLAGTRKRGRTEKEDQDLERELLADEKERAEHIMLVDLGRNDVGRVAEIGSVEVTELMGVERYSHVMHIVSHIRGRIAAGKNGFDVLRAAFPAGTVSGAPKIRAMQIIEELEKVQRGTYAGAVGYFSFSGNMDTCITIRSILIKGGRVYVQAGAGIVADSQAEKEYEETLNKAQAIFKAINVAEEGLP